MIFLVFNIDYISYKYERHFEEPGHWHLRQHDDVQSANETDPPSRRHKVDARAGLIVLCEGLPQVIDI